jgi:hypothetical protein
VEEGCDIVLIGQLQSGVVPERPLDPDLDRLARRTLQPSAIPPPDAPPPLPPRARLGIRQRGRRNWTSALLFSGVDQFDVLLEQRVYQ